MATLTRTLAALGVVVPGRQGFGAQSFSLPEDDDFWPVWSPGNLPGLDLPSYDPYHEKVGRKSCARLCAGLSSCAAAVWNIDEWCYLKEDITWTTLWAHQSRNTWVYIKGQVSEFSHMVSSPLIPPPTHVLVGVFCKSVQPMKVMFELLTIERALYDVCLEVPKGVFAFGQYSTSVILLHLLSNFQAYQDGLTLFTYFIIDVPEEPFAVGDITADVAFSRWTLREFVARFESDARPLRGAHVVETGEDVGDLAARIRRLCHLLHVAPPWTPQPARGLKRCGSLARPPRPLVPPRPGTNASRARRAIVTHLASPEALVSVRVLLHSLMRCGSQAEIVVALPGSSLLLEEGSGNLGFMEQLTVEFPHVRIIEWTFIPPPMRDDLLRKGNYAKLHVFNMLEYDRILYLDANVLALRSPDQLFDQPFEDHIDALMAPDWNRWRTPPATFLDSAVMLVRPSRALYICLRKELSTITRDDFEAAETENGFLSYIFGDAPTQLSVWWNFQQSFKQIAPEMWDEHRVSLLQFSGYSPARFWAPAEFNRRRVDEFEWSEFHEAHIEKDRPVESDSLVSLWRREYFSLADFSKSMTVFVTNVGGGNIDRTQAPYVYDEELFVEIWPRQDEPVSSLLLDVDDEFAAVLEMGRSGSYDKPWIGFTTSAEAQRAVSIEGAALDWVRVEQALTAGPSSRTVLFWHGICAGNYWELIDRRQPGLREAYSLIMHRMRTEIADLPMQPNSFWPVGSYIILPTHLLREFAEFAVRFLEHFRGEFGDTCPFNTSEAGVPHFQAVGARGARVSGRGGDGAPRSCLATLCEPLLHVWAVKAGVTLAFAVDADARCRTEKPRPIGGGEAPAPSPAPSQQPVPSELRKHVEELGTQPPQNFTSAAINQPAAGGDCGEAPGPSQQFVPSKFRKHVEELGTQPPQYFTSAAINQPAAGGDCGGGVFDFVTPQGTLTYPLRLRLRAGVPASDAAAALQRCTVIAQVVFPSSQLKAEKRNYWSELVEKQLKLLRTVGLGNQTVAFVPESMLEPFCVRLGANCVVLREAHFCGGGEPCVTRRMGQFGKIYAVKAILQQGFNALLLEADVFPLKDPFPHFFPDFLLQAPLDGYKRYSWKFHYFNNGVGLWRPSQLTINLLDGIMFNGAVSMDEAEGRTEQGLANQQIVAVEDWLPDAHAVNFTISLDPTIFAQAWWAPPMVYFRSGKHTKAHHASLFDYLASPPSSCERKASRMVVMHFNGVDKDFSEKIMHDGGINCTAAVLYREEFNSKTLCNVDKGVSKRICADALIPPPGEAAKDHEYWAWDEELGRVWDPSLRLVNGRFVGEVSDWAAKWSEGSRPCWKLCSQGRTLQCQDPQCWQTDFIIRGGPMITS